MVDAPSNTGELGNPFQQERMHVVGIQLALDELCIFTYRSILSSNVGPQ
jgi:hypothetical protein